MGELPLGFDHKYIYSHIGYNLKSGDIQAAIGIAQLARLDSFIELRRNNWQYLNNGLQGLGEYLQLPHATIDSDPSWFGFAITVREESPIRRREIIQKLDEKLIAT